MKTVTMDMPITALRETDGPCDLCDGTGWMNYGVVSDYPLEALEGPCGCPDGVNLALSQLEQAAQA